MKINYSSRQNPVSQRAVQDWGEMMHRGDKRCKYKIGTRVKKIQGEPGDSHSIGSRGIITGNIYSPELSTIALPSGKTVSSAYLVKFNGDEHETFLVEYKIRKLFLGLF